MELYFRNVHLSAALDSLPGDEPLRTPLWNFNHCLDRNMPLDYPNDVFGHDFLVLLFCLNSNAVGLMILLGCNFVFVSAAAPNRRSLGSTYGL